MEHTSFLVMMVKAQTCVPALIVRFSFAVFIPQNSLFCLFKHEKFNKLDPKNMNKI